MLRPLSKSPLIDVLFAHLSGRRAPSALSTRPRPAFGSSFFLRLFGGGRLARPWSIFRPLLALRLPPRQPKFGTIARTEMPPPMPQGLRAELPRTQSAQDQVSASLPSRTAPTFDPSLERLFDLEELHLAYALQLSFDDMATVSTRNVAEAADKEEPRKANSLIDPRDELRWLARRSLGLSTPLDGPRLPFADV